MYGYSCVWLLKIEVCDVCIESVCLRLVDASI
jgi:hypothetical protein